jgi:hypothetical protein
MSQSNAFSYLFAVFAVLMIVMVAYGVAGPQIDALIAQIKPLLAALGV